MNLEHEADHEIIKRVVRSVLEKSLPMPFEQIERTACEVQAALERECGGDRLYVRVPRARTHVERDARIRSQYQELRSQHSSRLAFEIIARREALGIRQLQRICFEPQLSVEGTQREISNERQ